MATLDNVDYAVHLPSKHARDELDQNQEWCAVEIDGERRRIRFRDYAAIYALAGLYERLFTESLDCDSPRVVTELLDAELRAERVPSRRLTALDFGAGNGWPSWASATLSASTCLRRRGMPRTATARPLRRVLRADFTQLRPPDRRDLMRHGFDLMTCVAALGFGDIPRSRSRRRSTSSARRTGSHSTSATTSSRTPAHGLRRLHRADVRRGHPAGAQAQALHPPDLDSGRAGRVHRVRRREAPRRAAGVGTPRGGLRRGCGCERHHTTIGEVTGACSSPYRSVRSPQAPAFHYFPPY
jgi:hypothetical protein